MCDCAKTRPQVRKDKYHGKKFYVEYQDDDEELDREDEAEEHIEEGDALGMHFRVVCFSHPC